jgi:hypothetical protein
MSWLKVDDGFHSHPKVMRAGTAAAGLWVRCGSYVAQHLTDGFVPREVANTYGTRSLIKALVDNSLWIPTDGGWLMHDYAERNPSREQVEADRAAAADRQRRAREAARAKREAEQAAKSQRESQEQSHRDSHRSSDAVTVPPTRPDPTRPVLPTEVQPQTPSGGRGKRAATPPPEDFPLTAELRAWGSQHAPHITDPAAETRQFLDHALATGKTYRDWTAAWRKWMGNAEKYALERRGSSVRHLPNRATADPTGPEHDERKALFQ